ncbi:MAG: hypothetical protein KAR40_14355, partial [Candidatus Sabulitectum sp.]|nr:hypothetical protein [Candidatus Sabulitectum sp.]
MNKNTDEASARPFDIAADWLSFSVKRPAYDSESVVFENVHNFIRARFPELKPDSVAYDKMARAPYSGALKLGVGGLMMFSADLNHMLIEIQGKGCRNLEDTGEFYAVATRALSVCMNITRFDLAVDFETDIDPEDFAKFRSPRFKSGGVYHSETGKTAYVGSPNSVRRARVYRYYPPHERAHLLRVEMVLKKPDAKQALLDYLDKGAENFAAMAGKSFGWSHPLWQFTSSETIKSWRPERGQASTMRWLYKAVLPALTRLQDEEVITDNNALWQAIAGRAGRAGR